MPFPLLLVARLAAVASSPVVALGNVHANVHSVVTCRDNTTEGAAGQITLEKGNYINPNGWYNPYCNWKDKMQQELVDLVRRGMKILIRLR